MTAKDVIKKGTPVPRYYQLAEYMREKIQSEKLSPGSALWSERNLMAEHNISLATVRKAYDLLVEEGLIVKEHGRGVFVADKKCPTITLRALLNKNILPQQIWQKIACDFTKANPHIKIDCLFGLDQELRQGLAEQFKPDIYSIDESSWRIFRSRDALLNLKDIILDSDDFFQGIYKKVADSFQDASGIYGLPYRFSTFAVFYNKELFKKQGVPFPEKTTWSSFLEAAKKLTVKRSNGTVKHYGFMPNSTINSLAMYVRQNGGTISPFDFEKGFNSPQVKEAIKFWYTDMLHTYNIAPGGGVVDAFDLFLAGKLAMFTERYFSASMLAKRCDFEWGVAPLPLGKERACSLPAQALAISKKTKSLDSALTFIKFVASTKTQKTFAGEGWGLPTKATEAEKLPFSKTFIDELEYAQTAWPYYYEKPRKKIKAEMSLLRLNLQNTDVTCNRIARQCQAFAEKLERKGLSKFTQE